LIPEVLEHYGSGKACALFATTKDQESYQAFTVGGANFTFPVATLELTVEKETAIKADFYATVASDLTISSGTLTGGNFAIVASVDSVAESSMADLTAEVLQGIIDTNLATAISAVNSALSAGIALPSDIKGVDFTNASLDFKDGFLALGLTPSTQNWIRLGSAMRTTKGAILSEMEAPVSVMQF
jgi:hypothetical protein